MLKLYIAVLDDFPDFMVPTLVAHTMLGAHLKMSGKSELYDRWLQDSFKKVVVRVNQKEFDKITALGRVVLGHENNTLGGKPSCIIVEPNEEIPKVLQFAKLWKPK